MTNPTVIVIDFPLDDTADSLAKLAQKLDPVLKNRLSRWQLDLRQCTAFGAGAAAMIEAAVQFAATRAFNMTFPDDLAVATIVGQYVDAVPVFEYSADKSGQLEREVVPAAVFKDVHARIADPIVKLISENSVLSEDAEEYLRMSLGEVTQNVIDHAESPFGGVWCARYVPDVQQVQVATVDCGLGIRQTLRRQFPDVRSSGEAIQRVLQGNASSLSRKNNLGLGLSNLAGFVRQCRGRLVILSGDAACELEWDQEEPKILEGGSFWHGTLVVFVLSTNPPRD